MQTRVTTDRTLVVRMQCREKPGVPGMAFSAARTAGSRKNARGAQYSVGGRAAASSRKAGRYVRATSCFLEQASVVAAPKAVRCCRKAASLPVELGTASPERTSIRLVKSRLQVSRSQLQRRMARGRGFVVGSKTRSASRLASPRAGTSSQLWQAHIQAKKARLTPPRARVPARRVLLHGLVERRAAPDARKGATPRHGDTR